MTKKRRNIRAENQEWNERGDANLKEMNMDIEKKDCRVISSRRQSSAVVGSRRQSSAVVSRQQSAFGEHSITGEQWLFCDADFKSRNARGRLCALQNGGRWAEIERGGESPTSICSVRKKHFSPLCFSTPHSTAHYRTFMLHQGTALGKKRRNVESSAVLKRHQSA
jgi:hypothetical protein